MNTTKLSKVKGSGFIAFSKFLVFPHDYAAFVKDIYLRIILFILWKKLSKL